MYCNSFQVVRSFSTFVLSSLCCLTIAALQNFYSAHACLLTTNSKYPVQGRLISDLHFPLHDTNVTFTCSINDVPSESDISVVHDSSQLRLFYRFKKIPIEPTIIINDTSAKFILRQINIDQSGVYICRLVTDDSLIDESELVDHHHVKHCSTYVTVIPPKSLNCDYEFRQSLSCRWQGHLIANELAKVSYRLSANRSDELNSKTIGDCVMRCNNLDCKCDWNWMDNFEEYYFDCAKSNFIFKLNTTIAWKNVLEHVSETIPIHCIDIVHLPEPTNVRIVESNETALTVAWNGPMSTYGSVEGLVFTIVCELDAETYVDSLSMRYRRYNITDLPDYVHHLHFYTSPSRSMKLPDHNSSSMICQKSVHGPSVISNADWKFNRNFSISRLIGTNVGVKNYTIADLLPGMPYLIHVSYYNASLGENSKKYVSKVVALEAETKQSVPLYSPFIEPTSFTVTNIPDSNARNVSLFWQPIDDWYLGTLKTEIRYYIYSAELDGSSRAFPPPIKSMKYEFENVCADSLPTCGHAIGQLQRDSAYIAFVGSVSLIGPHIGRSSIIIPREEDILPPVLNLIVELGQCHGEYTLRWQDIDRMQHVNGSSISSLHANYTIYWCYVIQTNECDFLSGSLTIGANINTTIGSFSMSLDDSENMVKHRRFAIAYSSAKGLSPMTWSTCVYNHEENPMDVCFEREHTEFPLWQIVILAILFTISVLITGWLIVHKPIRNARTWTKSTIRLPPELSGDVIESSISSTTGCGDEGYPSLSGENIKLMDGDSVLYRREFESPCLGAIDSDKLQTTVGCMDARMVLNNEQNLSGFKDGFGSAFK